MESISRNKKMLLSLKKFAYINVQKMPANKVSKDKEIQQAYLKTKVLLWDQIELFNPNVIIFGKTFNHFRLDFKDLTKIEDNCYFSENRLIISAYHPNQRKIKREKYVNDIISLVEKHFKKSIN